MFELRSLHELAARRCRGGCSVQLLVDGALEIAVGGLTRGEALDAALELMVCAPAKRARTVSILVAREDGSRLASVDLDRGAGPLPFVRFRSAR